MPLVTLTLPNAIVVTHKLDPDTKAFLTTLFAPLTQLSSQLTATENRIMSGIADVQNELQTVTSKLADAVTRIAAHEQAEDAANAAKDQQVATLTAANADLQTQIDALKAGGTDTTALDAIMATLKGVETTLDGIDATPSTTAPASAPSGETQVP